MTTTVTVRVGGQYRATVTQDGNEPVVVGPDSERSFSLPHPATGTFEITEEPVEAEAAAEPDAAEEPETPAS